jgi:hypothetical protein
LHTCHGVRPVSDTIQNVKGPELETDYRTTSGSEAQIASFTSSASRPGDRFVCMSGYIWLVVGDVGARSGVVVKTLCYESEGHGMETL